MIREGEAGLKNCTARQNDHVLLCRAEQRMSTMDKAIRDTTSQDKVGGER